MGGFSGVIWLCLRLTRWPRLVGLSGFVLSRIFVTFSSAAVAEAAFISQYRHPSKQKDTSWGKR